MAPNRGPSFSSVKFSAEKPKIGDNKLILEFAKRFANSGFYVFPLYNSNSGPQKPYGWAGNKPKDDIDPKKIIHCTNIASEIDEWPELIQAGYNSTIVHYGVMGIGHFLFDIDNKNGKNGSAKFKEFREKFQLPQPKFVVKSKSGGYHLYYAKPGKLENHQIKSIANIAIAGEKYEGIDIRGDGGMVLGPTSDGPEDEWEAGTYRIIVGGPESDLSSVPERVVYPFLRTSITNDLDNLSEIAYDDSNVFDTLKRAEIPDSLSLGQRNEGFYIFLNAIKNKGFSKATAARMAGLLKAVTEEPETFDESVPLSDMLDRVFEVNSNNPSDVCNDLLNHGLYRLTSYRNKIMYVILNDNPYIDSRNPHDLQGMKQLLGRFARRVNTPEGKVKTVNPADLLDRKIDVANEAATIGFKPGGPDIFSLTSENGGKRYLNIWNDCTKFVNKAHIVDKYWDQFRFIMSRVFGPEGSEEYQLGIDFIAWILQMPGHKPSIAPFLMSSRRGVGKSLLFSVIQCIFGHNKLGDLQGRPYKVEEVSSRFFDPSGSSILMFDEVQFAVHRDMRRESTHFWRHLKNLVTAEVVPVEYKGGATVYLPNVSGVMLAGNTGSHFPIEEFDRRLWIIDNDPPVLVQGLVDDLFRLVKGQMQVSEREVALNTLQYKLLHHKISIDLDKIRAPMNEIKKEMYLSTLSDIEEWWMTHFDDNENLLATTPILSKSAIIYLIETSDRLMNTRYREDPEGTFRDLKRRGLLKPIRLQSNNYQTRNLNGVPLVQASGDIMENTKREVLYTTRQHGDFNVESNETVVQAYIQNLHTIKRHRERIVKNRGSVAMQLEKESQ